MKKLIMLSLFAISMAQAGTEYAAATIAPLTQDQEKAVGFFTGAIEGTLSKMEAIEKLAALGVEGKVSFPLLKIYIRTLANEL